jgi:hypothetical protein
VDEIARSSAEFALSNAAIMSFSKGKRGFFLEFDGKSKETLAKGNRDILSSSCQEKILVV